MPDPHDIPLGELLTTIKITLRDLDTDARSSIEIEAAAPPDPAHQRTRLIDAVRRSHPNARIRSFADGAASFIDRQHLVVASYSELPARSRGSGGAPQAERLFDEAASAPSRNV